MPTADLADQPWRPQVAGLLTFSEAVSTDSVAREGRRGSLGSSAQWSWVGDLSDQPSPWVGPGKPNLPLGLRVLSKHKLLLAKKKRNGWESVVQKVNLVK